uniref:radial spoke protein ARM37 isoform X1 n=1 Tax=Ciona intestinalis TaxID=7719 RepID=UPI00006A3C32|nr:radial spoke protein ARM37 isoform X1 [Ciona intestinalis]|eukprot:XP_018670222.1 radial spoke protein ARM37 isoform X1 [Ciona intestinalis]
MATTRISYTLPPNIDATKAPLAFGSRALPKLNRELNDDTLITRQRALMTLCDLVHDPEKVYESIGVGCIESLKKLLSDADSTVRHKSTEVLYIMATHNVGRNAFLDYKVILPVAKLFDDNVDIVRKNAHQALKMLSEIPAGAAGIVSANLIPKLVNKLKIEIDEIKELILDTLHFCMRVDAENALKSGVMPVLTELLDHSDPSVRGAAARDMMDVSVTLAGKEAACEDASIVPLLVRLLTDVDASVKSSAAGALMTIAITTKGKYAAIRAGAIPSLLKLVNASSSETRLYGIKALTMLSEAPEGRKTLLEFVDEIKDREDDPESAAVARAAQTALKVITWKP